MPKWKNCNESGRKYKVEWEKEFPWVKKNLHTTQENAYCKVCKKSVSARKAALSQHANTKDHKLKVSAQSHSRKIVNVIKLSPKFLIPYEKQNWSLLYAFVAIPVCLQLITLVR